MDLSAERWESVESSEREAIARRLADELPSGFSFQGIHRFRCGERQHHVALYQQNDATFALMPSAAAVIGYDADRPWEPAPDELESWQCTSEEYGIDKSIREYIASVTTRIRRAELPPFLIETNAREFGWESVDTDDAEVRDILREYGKKSRGTVEISRGGATIRVRWDQNGAKVAERSVSCTHAELASRLAAAGFRFPTSDEWEYACGGGAPTLFRWGDHVPCDRYPTDKGFTSDWNCHREPNAFGLSIASDPYKYELVSEIGVTRGGDGGGMICGGIGFFVGWLTLATAYFEEHSCRHEAAKPVCAGFTFGRRVLELR
jgi:hypothetical protein